MTRRSALALLPLEDRCTPATLYVLTHGLQMNRSTVPDWIPDMAEAISRHENLGTTPIQIDLSIVSNDSPTGAAPNGAANFLLFNWAADSGLLDPGTADDPEVAGKLAHFVRERFPATGTLDVHFLGHSRGAYVNLAAIEALNNDMDNAHIGKLQMTTFDPEYYSSIFNREDRPLVVPSNVDVADNYYQRVDPATSIPTVTSANDPWFGGQTVAGALNVDLSDALREWPGRSVIPEITPTHAEVHDWYHWTIESEPFAHRDSILNEQQAGFISNDPKRMRSGLFSQQLDLNLDGETDNLAAGAATGFDYSHRNSGGPEVAIGADAGGSVRIFHPNSPAQTGSITPFPGVTAAVRVANADFNGDGVPELAAGSGPGVPGLVRVLDGVTHETLFEVTPFESHFLGGVFVAAGDLSGDDRPELVVTPDKGGGPRIAVFSGIGFTRLIDFFGIEDANFRGGVRTALGDFDGDGRSDLAVSAGYGGGPRLALFQGPSIIAGSPVKLTGDFFAFEPGLRNGAFVAAGDMDNDGRAELLVGAGLGGSPRIRVFGGATLLTDARPLLADFFLGDSDRRGGVRVALRDLDGDGRADLLGGSGEAGGGALLGLSARNLDRAAELTQIALNPFSDYAGGLFVA